MAPALLRRLQAHGWPVLLLTAITPPSDRAADLPSGVPVVDLGSTDEGDIQDALGRVRDAYGPIAAVVYLHPRVPAQGLVSLVAPVRLPFLLAKHVQADLVAAAREAWSGFFTVTRLDGVLGTSGDLPGGVHDLAAAGLSGLTKTLRLEWPTVAVRAIDLAPSMPLERAALRLVAEILDPNRLLSEVGWTLGGRMTLESTLPLGPKPEPTWEQA